MDKLQKLLAMAEHPNSNENEAAVALEMAQKLLLEANLTRADVNVGETNDTPSGIGQLSRQESDGYVWKRSLVHVIAKNNLCKIIGDPGTKTWHIFGEYHNVLAVLEMFNWVTLQLVWMANREFRLYKNDEGRERGQTWKLGFYHGAIDAINKRLTPPMTEFAGSTGKSLVIMTNQNLDTAVGAVFPKIRKSRGSSIGSLSGLSAGRAAGSTMSLADDKRLSGGRLLLD